MKLGDRNLIGTNVPGQVQVILGPVPTALVLGVVMNCPLSKQRQEA